MAKKKTVKRPAKKLPKKTAKTVARRAAPAKKKAAPKARRVQPIPAGYRTVTPYLVVTGVAKLLDFLKAAFNGKEKFRSAMPDGTIMHAELKLGDSMVMMGEARPDQPPLNCSIYLYVKDVDKVHAQAVKAGGISIMDPADQFYGDRNGGIKDPCGNQWYIGTHIEDVSPKEIQRRMAALPHGKK